MNGKYIRLLTGTSFGIVREGIDNFFASSLDIEFLVRGHGKTEQRGWMKNWRKEKLEIKRIDRVMKILNKF
jgi:hypothetical protein